MALPAHEEVIAAEHDGVTMIVAVHSTALGPALGGTRMSAYADAPDPAAAARADALRLSTAMTYKNALAGLAHGGGKGVIVADPSRSSTDLLHAYGRLVASFEGRYVTAGDVGMTVADMDVIGEVCPWTTGRSPDRGGVGDSGILTALGVFEGMRAAAEVLWGTADLSGRRVGVVGAGKVGGRLVGHLLAAGAEVLVVDPSPLALAALDPAARRVASVDDLLAADLDVLSPNALGGFVTQERAQQLDVALVCGGANNQLAEPEVAEALAERGVLYAPDFLVNCGGVIQVAEERAGGDLDRARAATLAVFGTTGRVLRRAAAEGITPVEAAEREAEERIRVAGEQPSAGSRVL
jgi:valine dehydrogenase (NAD+)